MILMNQHNDLLQWKKGQLPNSLETVAKTELQGI